ncbi:hypothetical protein CCP4SC76_600029 [Gammaproteobacteria bacterium]
MVHVAVIGSGPSGVACTRALVERGVKVTVLDIGEVLDTERKAIVERMKGQAKWHWSVEDVRTITRNPTIFGSGVPRKVVFGSDFYFSKSDRHLPTDSTAGGGTSLCSAALGGFSVAWGGALLPIHEVDMSLWPFSRSELDRSYERVMRWIPLSARNDDQLAKVYPTYTNLMNPLNIPGQANTFLTKLARAPALDGINRAFGQARLAIRTEADDMGEGCCYCGLCLSGCVYGAIQEFGYI